MGNYLNIVIEGFQSIEDIKQLFLDIVDTGLYEGVHCIKCVKSKYYEKVRYPDGGVESITNIIDKIGCQVPGTALTSSQISTFLDTYMEADTIIKIEQTAPRVGNNFTNVGTFLDFRGDSFNDNRPLFPTIKENMLLYMPSQIKHYNIAYFGDNAFNNVQQLLKELEFFTKKSLKVKGLSNPLDYLRPNDYSFRYHKHKNGWYDDLTLLSSNNTRLVKIDVTEKDIRQSVAQSRDITLIEMNNGILVYNALGFQETISKFYDKLTEILNAKL